MVSFPVTDAGLFAFSWELTQILPDCPKDFSRCASNTPPDPETPSKVSSLDRTDSELIEAYRRGDVSAVETLVRRYLTRIRGLLYQLVIDRDDADDLTQEVFIHAIRNLHQFRGDGAFTTWLYRIAVNTARQSARRVRSRPGEMLLVEAEACSPGLAPDGLIVRDEKRDQVHQALAKLAPPLRSAVVLTVMQGLSAREASEIESCPLGTMYWRIHEARRLLRIELKGIME